MQTVCGMPAQMQAIMKARFGKDTLIALATTDGETPHVRAVNAYYADGAFYVVTHGKSAKMRQMKKNPHVAICGEWFTGHGVGENLGWVMKETNAEMMRILREAFSSWYGGGHVDEADPDTCLLRICLTSGVLMSHGTRYEMKAGYSGDLS